MVDQWLANGRPMVGGLLANLSEYQEGLRMIQLTAYLALKPGMQTLIFDSKTLCGERNENERLFLLAVKEHPQKRKRKKNENGAGASLLASHLM